MPPLRSSQWQFPRAPDEEISETQRTAPVEARLCERIAMDTNQPLAPHRCRPERSFNGRAKVSSNYPRVIVRRQFDSSASSAIATWSTSRGITRSKEDSHSTNFAGGDSLIAVTLRS